MTIFRRLDRQPHNPALCPRVLARPRAPRRLVVSAAGASTERAENAATSGLADQGTLAAKYGLCSSHRTSALQMGDTMAAKKTSRKANAVKSAPTRRVTTSATSIDTPQQLRALIEQLSPASPMTDRFSAEWRRHRHEDGQQERETPWYETQHEHWLGWLAGWDGPGAYGRQDWNRSAEYVYNHIVNPQMLVYLAEAVGVPKKQVAAAVSAALSNRRTMAAMSAAIRRLIPWTTIERALLAR